MKSIDGVVNKIIAGNDKIAKAVEENPRLRDSLYGRVAQNYEKYKGVVKGAEFVDKVDRILGPLEAALEYIAPIGTPQYGIFRVAELAELALLKIPYSIYYSVKTRDYKTTAGWAAAEAATYLVPFANVADVVNMYKMGANNFIKKTSEREFLEHYLTSPVEEGEIKKVASPASLPSNLAARHRAHVSDDNVLYLKDVKPKYRPVVKPHAEPYKASLEFEASDHPYDRGWHVSKVDLPNWVRELVHEEKRAA